jgi:hypothetical protein
VATKTPEALKTGTDSVEYFLRYFGEPNDGLGNFQGSLSEHLFVNNAGHFRTLAQARNGNLADTVAKMKGSPEEKADYLFLSVLSRSPKPAERERMARYIGTDAKMHATMIEEVVWVLFSSSEFRFNH